MPPQTNGITVRESSQPEFCNTITPKAEVNSERPRYGRWRADDPAVGVIQALKPKPRIMRYELNDFEWTAIKPMLPNKPCGVRRVRHAPSLGTVPGDAEQT
jgi:hypothetical protein